jgi:hypothetical protein
LLLTVDAMLVVNHLAWQSALGTAPNLFNLDGEANIPAWWSSSQLLVAGLLIAVLVFRNHRADSRSWSLAALAATIIAFSLDETAGLHERAGNIIDSYVREPGDLLSQSGYWPFFVGIPVVVFIAYLIRSSASFMSEAAGTRWKMLLSFVVFFSGALVGELLNNLEPQTLGIHMQVVEEALEMIGGSFLAWSALELFRQHPSTAYAWKLLRPL